MAFPFLKSSVYVLSVDSLSIHITCIKNDGKRSHFPSVCKQKKFKLLFY